MSRAVCARHKVTLHHLSTALVLPLCSNRFSIRWFALQVSLRLSVSCAVVSVKLRSDRICNEPRCQTCPQAFCEDCLHPGPLDAVGDNLPELYVFYGPLPLTTIMFNPCPSFALVSSLGIRRNHRRTTFDVSTATSIGKKSPRPGKRGRQKCAIQRRKSALLRSLRQGPDTGRSLILAC